MRTTLANSDYLTITAVLFYGAGCLFLGNAPLMDLPNHLARAHIIGELMFSGDSMYADSFRVHLQLTPYLMGDLAVSLLDRALGLDWASRIWICLAVVLPPLSMHFVTRTLGSAASTQCVATLATLYISTDWFFLSGFLNYQMSIACVLFAYGWSLRYRAHPSLMAGLWFLVFLTAGYLLHLSSLVFITAIIGTVVAYQLALARSPARALPLLALCAVLLALHLGVVLPHGSPDGSPSWGTILSKTARLASPFIRFNSALDAALLAPAAALVAMPFLARGPWRAMTLSGEQVALGLMFCGLYAIMPMATGKVYDVDNRAVPLAFLFAVLAASRIPLSAPLQRYQLVLASLLALLNLAVVGYHVLPQERIMGHIKEIARTIPHGAIVLPVNTHAPVGRYDALNHFGSFATISAGAITPYLFSSPRNDPPISYFSYSSPPTYAPPEFWYSRKQGRVEWDTVADIYDFLLVTLPYDQNLLPASYVEVTRNSDAALLGLKERQSDGVENLP